MAPLPPVQKVPCRPSATTTEEPVTAAPGGGQHDGRAGRDADRELLGCCGDARVEATPAVVVGEVRHEGARDEGEPGQPGGVVGAEGRDALRLEGAAVGLRCVRLGRPAGAEYGGHRTVGEHDGRRAHRGRHGIPEGGIGHRRGERRRVLADEQHRRGAGQGLGGPALAAVDHRGDAAGPAGLLDGLAVGVDQGARAGAAAEDDQPGGLGGADGTGRGHDVTDDVAAQRAAAEEHRAPDARRG